MSLKYGLNVKGNKPPPVRKPVFDDDGEEDEPADDGPQEEQIGSVSSNGAPKKFGLNVPSKSKSKPTGPPKPPAKRKEEDREDLSSSAAAQARVRAAQEVDASIFDYDSFHDAKETVNEAKKAAAKQDAIERKPKYIANLLDAAERRKRDQLVAREKLLQKEREAEGDEFADKEKFVTGAYKEQQEESRKLDEEEKLKAEEEDKRKRQMGGGMQGFYKSMMDQSERQHQEAMEAAAQMEKEGTTKRVDGDGAKQKSEAELAAELKAKGVNVHLNEEGQITDKRELLSAGLNVGTSGKGKSSGADHLKTSARPAQSAFPRRDAGSQQAQRERQTRMLEEQLEATKKRKLEEEEEERKKQEQEAKSRKTETDVSDAKARYLARKAARERGEG